MTNQIFTSKLKVIFFLLTLLASKIGVSQTCTGPFVFSTQSEVDAFIIDNPTCTQIIGDVFIVGNAIHSVEAFHNIESIQGVLYIEGTILNNVWGFRNVRSVYSLQLINVPVFNLHGFINLQNVDFDFILAGTGNLTNLAGLYDLHTIGGSFIVSGTSISNFSGSRLISVGYFNVIGNNNIYNFNGMEYLTTIYSGMSVINNQNLQNFNGLSDLSTINGYLYIRGNNNLISTNGMNSLLSVKDITMIENPSLVHVDGFPNLNEANSLSLTFNPNLSTVSGFNNLNRLEYLIISENGSLNNISAFNRNFLVGFGIITYNLSLSTCHVVSICNLIDRAPHLITIVGNATGCWSKSEVDAQCMGSMKSDDNVQKGEDNDLNARSNFKNSDVYPINKLLSPNPGNGIFQVKLSNDVLSNLVVINIQGQAVYSANQQQGIVNVDISTMPSGIYMLHIQNEEGNFIIKMIMN
ncbi:MAG: T9SS type A sorting domain-containing protein [Saprospiraceae bacterium]|nr:T9SS type A sorting domain-containing protein [Saprospiraceae bacterium]